MSDDRPKKSWREIDQARGKSSHRRDDKPLYGNVKKQRSQTSYRNALSNLFDSGKISNLVSERNEETGVSNEIDEDQGKIQLLREIKNAEDPKTIEKLTTEFLAKFPLPEDVDALAKFIEHPSPNIQEDAMTKLLERLAEATPKRARTLIGRLKYIRDMGDDKALQGLATKLIDRLS